MEDCEYSFMFDFSGTPETDDSEELSAMEMAILGLTDLPDDGLFY